ncbi:trans-sulfuration enzyme family protein [Nonomuraea africana]|uniref:Cystathionine gamma-lyase n=1 Tax=Nonomuraea africana TaxID=46171 RepID=A0ABR9KES6_9ACTN|nr:PLP-dependent aspartate aminotransferase family protein [Nonomuraea africana]MBE1560489.1 cystathionine gamma-lyase [Nonomuraea africana]
MRLDTKLIHAGRPRDPGTGDVIPPVHLSATYDRRLQDPPQYFYGRGENPTREDLELCLAALENAAFATAYASGQAAATAVVSLLSPGDRVVCSDNVYSGTRSLLEWIGKYGIAVEYADLAEPSLVERAVQGAALVWVESPTNPLMKIADLDLVCRAAHATGATVVVDNTLAGPLLQQPLSWGADITLYSTTKSISGHLDVIGGALVYNRPELHDHLLAHRTATGGVPGALDCFLIHRGLRTLSVRVERQVRTTEAIAAMLSGHPSVSLVHYPGLPGHPQYDVAKRQMSGPGSVLSFEYAGDPVELMARLRFFSCAVSLGGVHSLIECPAMMTQRPVPREVRLRMGLSDRLIRLSVGLEDRRDLLEDLLEAMRGGDPP